MFKHTKKLLALFFVLAISIIFISCQDQQPVATNDTGQMDLSKVSTFVMPAGATLVSANLKIFSANFGANPINVDVHSITADWSCPVTWNSFAEAYNPAIISTFDMAHPGENSIDVTAEVQAWLNGDPNYGLLLKIHDVYDPLLEQLGQFASNEWPDPTLRPFLEIVTTAGTDSVIPLYDTYINTIDPDLSYCDAQTLFIGYVDNGGGVEEKQDLIRFDIEPTPPQMECETAFAYDDAPEGTCFLDLGFDRWGWSIYLSAPGTYTFPVYAAAGQCDLTKGTYVGDVTAVYADGTVTFEYDFEPGFSAEEMHFYAGYNPVASDKKGNPTVAPGQYTIGTGLSGGIYIIAHAVVCSDNWE